MPPRPPEALFPVSPPRDEARCVRVPRGESLEGPLPDEDVVRAIASSDSTHHPLFPDQFASKPARGASAHVPSNYDSSRTCERSRICTQKLRIGSDDAGRCDDARRGGYEQGDNDVSALIDAADRETSGIVSGRLADGSLDDHATDHASSVFARTVLLAERRWNPSGDLAELVAIHRGLFDGVFSDAGRLRTSNVTREVTDKRHQAKNPEAFFPAQLIETGALNISTELADKRNLDNLDRACSSGSSPTSTTNWATCTRSREATP